MKKAFLPIAIYSIMTTKFKRYISAIVVICMTATAMTSCLQTNTPEEPNPLVGTWNITGTTSSGEIAKLTYQFNESLNGEASYYIYKNNYFSQQWCYGFNYRYSASESTLDITYDDGSSTTYNVLNATSSELKLSNSDGTVTLSHGFGPTYVDTSNGTSGGDNSDGNDSGWDSSDKNDSGDSPTVDYAPSDISWKHMKVTGVYAMAKGHYYNFYFKSNTSLYPLKSSSMHYVRDGYITSVNYTKTGVNTATLSYTYKYTNSNQTGSNSFTLTFNSETGGNIYLVGNSGTITHSFTIEDC